MTAPIEERWYDRNLPYYVIDVAIMYFTVHLVVAILK